MTEFCQNCRKLPLGNSGYFKCLKIVVSFLSPEEIGVRIMGGSHEAGPRLSQPSLYSFLSLIGQYSSSIPFLNVVTIDNVVLILP